MAGASEGEIPEEECSPEGLEQTMRRVLKSELEAQTDLLRQQINEDVSLHFAERSVEAISRKAQEIVEASITLENSLRDHKEFLQNLLNQDALKSSSQKSLPQLNLKSGELLGSPVEAPRASHCAQAWTDGAEVEEMSGVVPNVPVSNLEAIDEQANQPDGTPQRIRRGVIHKKAMADEFMKDVREEEEEDYLAEDGEAAKSIRARARWLLSQQWFDMMIGACIILNSIIIGIQADWNVRNISVPEPEGFGVSEKIFAVIFTGELLLRIVGLGFRRFYCGPDWKWALFDTVVVSLQLFDEIITLAVGDDSAAGSQGNLGFMRVVRVLRLLRILRLVRILQFVNELRTMVMSVASSMRSLVWTLVLMLLMMYIIGVYLCQMIADSGAEDATILTKDLVDFYGNLPRAVLSLYQAMTGGVDWNDLSLPLEPISPIMSLIFALYIAFAVLAMMNVVTGVFVESALGSAREDREREVIHAVRKIFNMGDQNKNGVLSWNEFAATLEDPLNMRYFNTIGINSSEARGLFNLLDADDSGSISVQEFIQGCLRLRGQAKAIDLATLIYMTKRMVYWLQERLDYVEHSLETLLPQNAMKDEKLMDKRMSKAQGPAVKKFLDIAVSDLNVSQTIRAQEARGSVASVRPSHSPERRAHAT